MKTYLVFPLALLIVACFPASGGAQTKAPSKAAAAGGSAVESAIRTNMLDFLNRTVGWQELDKIDVKSISAPDPSGLRTVVVHMTKGDQSQDATYYVTADGKEVIEGDVSKLSGDPWAAIRAKITLPGYPAEGAANATVTMVEFSDLECPYCKQFSTAIQQVMQQNPGKLRVIFKYFPLTSIHPWSMQAAEAAVCVTEQNPPQFWNFANLVFTHQDEITTDNALQRLRDYAMESEAQPGPLQACLTNPATAAKVEASIAEGKSVGVTTTPTVFIDGRIIVGALEADQLQKLVTHEAAVGPGLITKVQGQSCSECKPLAPIKHP